MHNYVGCVSLLLTIRPCIFHKISSSMEANFVRVEHHWDMNMMYVIP